MSYQSSDSSRETDASSSEDAAAALYAAVESGSLEKVCIFLKENGNDLVNSVKPESLETPLHVAARLGNSDITRALIDAGARVDMGMRLICRFYSEHHPYRVHDDADALHIAAAFGHVSVIEVLLDASKPQNIDEKSRLLDFAAINGHLEALKFLLARFPHPPLASLKTQALGYALYYGQIECARYLIESGGDPTHHAAFALASPVPLPKLLTTSTTAVKTNQLTLDLLNMLMEAGADLDLDCIIRIRYGAYNDVIKASILSCAAAYGRFEAVEYFLANGADITSEWDYGWGALHFAVASGSSEAVELLLNAGASDQVAWKIAMPSRWSRTERRNLTALDIIGICDDRLHHPGNEDLVRDYTKIIKLLVLNGADLEAKDAHGNTALHSACLIADPSATAGCYIDYECVDDVRGEEYARRNMRPVHRMCPFILALLQNGANPTALNKKMQNPLHVLLMNVMGAVEDLSNESHWSYSSRWNKEKEKPSIQGFFAALFTSVRVLGEAGSSLSQRNVKAHDPLQALVHGYDKFYKEQHKEDFQRGLCNPLSTPQHELDPIIVELLRLGARSWDVVPDYCIGLEKILVDVWRRGDVFDLRYLFEKLDYRLKSRLKMILRVLNRFLPGHKEIHMQILADAL